MTFTFALQLPFGCFGFEDAHRWTLEKGLGWLFWPLAYLMGIPVADCGAAGQLLGTKMVANEFVELLQPGTSHAHVLLSSDRLGIGRCVQW